MCPRFLKGAYVVTTDEKGKPLQPQKCPHRDRAFLSPMSNGLARGTAFPMQMEIISISRMMISANR